jgi:hypothetical protein
MITRIALALTLAVVGAGAQPPTFRASGRSQTIVEASASYGPFHLTSQAHP